MSDSGSINPDTGQEYYCGTMEDVKVFCKSVNIDSGRLAGVAPKNLIHLMGLADSIINGYLSETYFLPIKKYNQVGVDGVPRLVFPGRIRYLAQQLVAGLLLMSEYQHQEQNLNEMGKTMVEEAKKEIHQMTLWSHRIPGQRYKSVISRTSPPNFEPPQALVEQIWSMN